MNKNEQIEIIKSHIVPNRKYDIRFTEDQQLICGFMRDAGVTNVDASCFVKKLKKYECEDLIAGITVFLQHVFDPDVHVDFFTSDNWLIDSVNTGAHARFDGLIQESCFIGNTQYMRVQPVLERLFAHIIVSVEYNSNTTNYYTTWLHYYAVPIIFARNKNPMVYLAEKFDPICDEIRKEIEEIRLSYLEETSAVPPIED